jgi:hypothetical protein
VLDRDLHLVENMGGGLAALMNELLLAYGSVRVLPDHFSGWSLGARFYPVLYMLTRIHGARDWETGIELKKNMLGKINALEVHHVFPKSRLYAKPYRYARSQVNAVANFCFLTKGANLALGDEPPEAYFPRAEKSHPGSLASQWIPMDERLWKIENYLEFLDARKSLLAQATNSLLAELYHGQLPERGGAQVTTVAASAIPGSIADAEEEGILSETNAWVRSQGLPAGTMSYEMVDAASGLPTAVLDLAWPDGLQPGFSKPVAILLNESSQTLAAASRNEYIIFTKVKDFREYIAAQSSGVVA